MEAVWGFGASAEAIAKRVTFENRDVVDAAREARQSVVLLTPHFCNWEWLLPAGGAYFGLPIDAVYQKQRVEFLDRFLRDARTRAGGKPIVREDFVYELMNRAAVPRGYALIADQTPPRGRQEALVALPQSRHGVFRRREKVAHFLDSPVLYVAMRRVGRGRYSVRLHPLAMPPFDEDDGTPIMERFARMLEAAVRESPADWLWLQKRWKYPKTDEPEPQGRPSTGAPERAGKHRARAVMRGGVRLIALGARSRRSQTIRPAPRRRRATNAPERTVADPREGAANRQARLRAGRTAR
jgi:KDO2-lipid IV(A) lauroyltransferase